MKKEGINLEGSREQEINNNIMTQLMQRLSIENADVGGILFSTFGKKDSQTLVFPTPIRIRIRRYGRRGKAVTVDEFLVVTQDGMKLIQVVDTSTRVSANDEYLKGENLSNYIMDRRSVKPGLGEGYRRREGILILGRLSISRIMTKGDGGFLQINGEPVYKNCRLIDDKTGRAEEIFRANIERVKATQAAAQKVNELFVS